MHFSSVTNTLPVLLDLVFVRSTPPVCVPILKALCREVDGGRAEQAREMWQGQAWQNLFGR